MRKKILILSIVLSFIAVLAIIISNSLYLRHLYSLIKIEPNYLTNISQLHSSFSGSMKDEVDLRLQLLGCEPKEYYYDNFSICFICDDIHPCFDYSSVIRERGIRKRNLRGFPYIAGVKEFEVQIADFCRDGWASEFNCQKIDESSLECEKIRFLGTSADGVLKCEEVRLVLKEGIELKDFASDFCKFKKKELRETTESLVSCGEYLIGLIENREIIIGIKLEEE